MACSGRLLVAPFGCGATAAWSHAIRAAQPAEPLAVVDVVVPSSVVGVSARRVVACSGLENVRFTPLPQLAERVAARHPTLTGACLADALLSDDQKAALRPEAVERGGGA